MALLKALPVSTGIAKVLISRLSLLQNDHDIRNPYLFPASVAQQQQSRAHGQQTICNQVNTQTQVSVNGIAYREADRHDETKGRSYARQQRDKWSEQLVRNLPTILHLRGLSVPHWMQTT